MFSDQGAEAATELLRELAQRIPGKPAAQGVGANLAALHSASDLMLERNQAFRAALLDLQHVTTLLGYTGALAGDDAGSSHSRERFKELEISDARRDQRAGARSGGRDRAGRRQRARAGGGEARGSVRHGG